MIKFNMMFFAYSASRRKLLMEPLKEELQFWVPRCTIENNICEKSGLLGFGHKKHLCYWKFSTMENMLTETPA